MSQDMLKTLRLFIPGVIVIVLLLPLLQTNLNIKELLSNSKFFQAIAYLIPELLLKSILVAVIGALYYIFDVRKYFVRSSLCEIHDNIKTNLLKPFQDDATIADNSERMREGRQMLHIFYNFIDKDESLKVKARNVYFNGLIWSSTADLTGASLMISFVYLLAYIVWNNVFFVLGDIILIFICLFTQFILMPRVTAKHIDLSNEQLEYIVLHYKEELHSKLLELTQSF